MLSLRRSERGPAVLSLRPLTGMPRALPELSQVRSVGRGAG